MKTVVVLPSLTFPIEELRKIIAAERYEERLLCFLLLLADPDLHVIFLSSAPVDPVVVDYYLSFLDDPAGARSRLELVAAGGPAEQPLSQKLLDRPDLLRQVRDLAAENGHILPFNVTALEAAVANELGLPLYGAHPDLFPLGSKSGARRVAREAGVPVLTGAEDLFSIPEVEAAIDELRKKAPHAAEAVIKLNNGFSGQGNAIVPLNTLRSPLIDSPTVFCAHEESWLSYARKIEDEGAIVEEMARGEGLTSPSAQLRIDRAGVLEEISTHDQILGGPDDQVYLGCRFPASPEYRRLIAEHAHAIGDVLVRRGVVGSFGIDFVVLPRALGFDVYLSEINLRMGGTTHPFFMARFVTGGAYDPATGELVAGGRPIHYVATDNLKSPAYARLSPQAVLAALDRRGLLYDRTARAGATLHLLGALHGYGKLGMLCIAGSREAADDLYADCVEALDDLAATLDEKDD